MPRISANSVLFLDDGFGDVAYRPARPACGLAMIAAGGPDLLGTALDVAGAGSAPFNIAMQAAGVSPTAGFDPFAALTGFKGPGKVGEAAGLALAVGQALKDGFQMEDLEALRPFLGSAFSEIAGTARDVIEALKNGDPQAAVGALFRGLADVPGVGPTLGLIGNMVGGNGFDLQGVITNLTGSGR